MTNPPISDPDRYDVFEGYKATAADRLADWMAAAQRLRDALLMFPDDRAFPPEEIPRLQALRDAEQAAFDALQESGS